MTSKKLSEEEMKQQKRMFEVAERIAMVIHHNPQDLFETEEEMLRRSPQLKAMVETHLSIMIAKSRNYTGYAVANWEIQDKGVIRHGIFQSNSSFSEGFLEIKEYAIEKYHLTSQTIGIHEMVFQKTLKASSAKELLTEVRGYLTSYGCPESELQRFYEK
jgi:hypothetical protein